MDANAMEGAMLLDDVGSDSEVCYLSPDMRAEKRRRVIVLTVATAGVAALVLIAASSSVHANPVQNSQHRFLLALFPHIHNVLSLSGPRHRQFHHPTSTGSKVARTLQTQAVCIGSWAIDAQCVSTFEYDGKTYQGCTTKDNGDEMWCSHDAHYVGSYSKCISCPTATQTPTLAPGACYDGWAANSQCVATFEYYGDMLQGCTTADNGGDMWCSLSTHYRDSYESCTPCLQAPIPSPAPVPVTSLASTVTAGFSRTVTQVPVTTVPVTTVTTTLKPKNVSNVVPVLGPPSFSHAASGNKKPSHSMTHTTTGGRIARDTLIWPVSLAALTLAVVASICCFEKKRRLQRRKARLEELQAACNLKANMQSCSCFRTGMLPESEMNCLVVDPEQVEPTGNMSYVAAAAEAAQEVERILGARDAQAMLGQGTIEEQRIEFRRLVRMLHPDKRLVHGERAGLALRRLVEAQQELANAS